MDAGFEACVVMPRMALSVTAKLPLGFETPPRGAFLPRRSEPLFKPRLEIGSTWEQSAAVRSLPAVRRRDQDCAFAGRAGFGSSSGARNESAGRLSSMA